MTQTNNPELSTHINAAHAGQYNVKQDEMGTFLDDQVHNGIAFCHL